MRRMLLLGLVLSVSSIILAQDSSMTKATTGPTQVKIGGAVPVPFTVLLEDMKKMPRKTVKVENAHVKRTEVYEGVPLDVLLQKAGVPQGEALRGTGMATYVLVDAADNYQVLFALAEIDSSFQDAEVLLADTMDGAPLPPDQGPFKLVAPHEKRPARWVKMVSSITIGRAGN